MKKEGRIFIAKVVGGFTEGVGSTIGFLLRGLTNKSSTFVRLLALVLGSADVLKFPRSRKPWPLSATYWQPLTRRLRDTFDRLCKSKQDFYLLMAEQNLY